MANRVVFYTKPDNQIGEERYSKPQKPCLFLQGELRKTLLEDTLKFNALPQKR